mmetsp:Transcript_16172/g.30493  ORF Transcript_16172/g.30493 Transcript_16172/m.30493 type:complete len:616 (+) Transcript_16172:258-2105(+)
MQQRRPHSNVAVSNGGADNISREERRMERRLAKERRAAGAGKKLKRVKRSNAKYNNNALLPWLSWKRDPYVQMTLLSFGLFSLIGITTYRMFHDGGTHHMHHSQQQPDKEGEYNSDTINTGGSSTGGLLSRLRGKKYVIPESLKNMGAKERWYTDLRREYDTEILPKDDERSVAFVEAERKRQGIYTQSPYAQTPYDIHNCPSHPPDGYPMQWPVLDVTANWPTDDPNPPSHKGIYQGLCIFDYRTDLAKAERYRHKERPFVMRNDPAVARTAERWLSPGYLSKLLMGKEDTDRRTEYSPNNHFMYWVDKRPRDERRKAAKHLKDAHKKGEDVHGGFGRGDQGEMKEAMQELEELNELKIQLADAKEYQEDHEDDDEAEEEVNRLQHLVAKAKKKKNEVALENWQPPTENLRMSYSEWLKHANVTDDKLGPDNPHWYFRLIGCGAMGDHTEDGSCDKGSSEWLFDELTFFQPRTDEERPFYLIEPKKQKGIHCRFGMKGVIAENHFDLSRNAITLLGGQRRYLLGDPSQCINMNLLPRGHPSARHSAVDWSNPDLRDFPTFPKTHVNEIVMQPGDVLYLPTNWFHYIVSLELNMQCNTRSGGENINKEYISECGF